MSVKKETVKKTDIFRSLLTEVLPTETPIIFSNDGFYLRAKRQDKEQNLADSFLERLVRSEGIFSAKKPWYVPYSYKVRKNAVSFRGLALLHPGAQWLVREFYEEMSPLILHYSSASPFSIRRPRKVAKTYYIKSAISDLARFKRSAVSDEETEPYLRHSPSYFAYSGYRRLYKFFDSVELIRLEAEFDQLWLLDVSKCFDSIYTHSISWAIKSKAFTKENLRGNTFAQVFDTLMQSANNGETNGIVIGPEVSRVFAELILQEVDRRVARRLERENSLVAGRDYAVRRYVDDFFIFAKDDRASVIAETINIELWEFKLSVNEGKLKKLARPFLTDKSKTILQVSEVLNRFTEKFCSPSTKNEARFLEPKEIYNLDRLALSFCNEVKLCCTENDCSYDEVSGYLISALKNRAALLMSQDSNEVAKIGAAAFQKALCLIVQVVFFLYRVAPTVASSYRLCALLIMVARFSERNLGDRSASVRALIYSLALAALTSRRTKRPSGFIDLESQNLLLAISDLGEDFLVPASVLDEVFCRDMNCSYFTLITLTFYVKTYPQFAAIRDWVAAKVGGILSNLRNVTTVAEVALTAFDFVGCPYLDLALRERWLGELASGLKLDPLSPSQVSEIIEDFQSVPWFTNWREADLLNLLERKELQAVY